MATNEELISIWSKAVETQMHFNEMSVRSRQLGLTFVTAALALGVVLISQNEDFSISLMQLGPWTPKLHVSVLLVLAATLGLQAVKKLDLGVYHKMLRGAVTFGEDFEQNYMSQVFELNKGMTQAISHFSRHDDAGKRIVDGKYEYIGTSEKNAQQKIEDFYSNTTTFLILAAVMIFIFTNDLIEQCLA